MSLEPGDVFYPGEYYFCARTGQHFEWDVARGVWSEFSPPPPQSQPQSQPQPYQPEPQESEYIPPWEAATAKFKSEPRYADLLRAFDDCKEQPKVDDSKRAAHLESLRREDERRRKEIEQNSQTNRGPRQRTASGNDRSGVDPEFPRLVAAGRAGSLASRKAEAIERVRGTMRAPQ